MTDALTLFPGEVVAGRYRIARLIGRGGSASVYAVDGHTGEGRALALKLMHADDPSGVGRQRFEREVALLRRLSHPNIVRVVDHGHDEQGLPFIVMPLLSGCSLGSLIKRHGAIAPRRVMHIALQVLSALIEAHAQGIVHRDIKPGNVFIGADDHVEVLDFGLAKALDGQGMLGARLTAVGHRVGTPRYMSPEMARGDEPDAASDLYALGLVMAELLCGRPLALDQLELDLLAAHASARPLALPTAALDSPLGAVLQRALAKSPAVRYRTALQMRADVEALAQLPELLLGAAPPGRALAAADLAPTLLSLPAPVMPAGARPARFSAGLALLFAVLLAASATAGYWLAG